MQQITLDRPGAFSTADVEQPSTAGPGEALCVIHRIGVCGTDLHAFAGDQPFFTYPRVLGHELGVEVIAVGEGVDPAMIKPGDRCAVEPYLNCGECIACRRGRPNCCTSLKVLGVHVDGGMQSHFVVPAQKLHKSDKLTLEQLALVETLSIGAHAVERAAPTPDESVLVIGTGPIGLGVIQMLKAEGVEPIVMDLSNDRLSFCRGQLGITRTVNPTDESDELPHQIKAVTGGDLPTLIIDATGHPGSMMGTFSLTAHGGRIVFVGLFQGEVEFHDPNFHARELTLMASRNSTPDTFRKLIALIEAGAIDTTPWITHRLKLADVPTRFPELPGSRGLIKAMIDVA